MTKKNPRRQCKKCPWRVGVDPHEIPNGYCELKHQALAGTIAEPGALNLGTALRIMACHETHKLPCVGWLVHQLSDGCHEGTHRRERQDSRQATPPLRGYAPMNPKAALRFAVLDARVCRERKMLLLAAWLGATTQNPQRHRLYDEYCEAKAAWQAAEARLYRLQHGDDGTHVRRAG